MRDELFLLLMDISINTGLKLDYLVEVADNSLDRHGYQELDKSLISSGGKSPRRARNRKSKVVP